MGKSRRDKIKAKHDAILNALVRCIGWTQELYQMFSVQHPQYAEGYTCVLVMLEQARQSIAKMREFI